MTKIITPWFVERGCVFFSPRLYEHYWAHMYLCKRVLRNIWDIPPECRIRFHISDRASRDPDTVEVNLCLGYKIGVIPYPGPIRYYSVERSIQRYVLESFGRSGICQDLRCWVWMECER